MHCTYTVSLADFKAAQEVAVARTWKSRLIFVIFQRLMPVLAVFVFAFLVWGEKLHDTSVSPWLGGLLFVVIWLGVYCPVSRRIQLGRRYRDMKNGRADTDPLEFEWNGEEIISRVPGLSEGRIQPAALKGFAEDERVALIYVAKNRFLVLPKRMMLESDWAELRHWLSANGVRG